jgi:hypothetical protein
MTTSVPVFSRHGSEPGEMTITIPAQELAELGCRLGQ